MGDPICARGGVRSKQREIKRYRRSEILITSARRRGHAPIIL